MFDNDLVTRVYNNRTTGNLPLTSAQFFAGGWDYDALIAQNPGILDVKYNQPDQFLGPREVRLGVKFTLLAPARPSGARRLVKVVQVVKGGSIPSALPFSFQRALSRRGDGRVAAGQAGQRVEIGGPAIERRGEGLRARAFPESCPPPTRGARGRAGLRRRHDRRARARR